MKICEQRDSVYLVFCPDRQGMTGRAHIKREMKAVAPGWPMTHIKINAGPALSSGFFEVRFNKKSIEHELIFKLAFS